MRLTLKSLTALVAIRNSFCCQLTSFAVSLFFEPAFLRNFLSRSRGSEDPGPSIPPSCPGPQHEGGLGGKWGGGGGGGEERGAYQCSTMTVRC